MWAIVLSLAGATPLAEAEQALAVAELERAAELAERLVHEGAADAGSRDDAIELLCAVYDAVGDRAKAKRAYERRTAKPRPGLPAMAVPAADLPRPGVAGEHAFVAASQLRVREGPNDASPVSGVLTINERLSVSESQGEWVKVDNDASRRGWVRRELLSRRAVERGVLEKELAAAKEPGVRAVLLTRLHALDPRDAAVRGRAIEALVAAKAYGEAARLAVVNPDLLAPLDGRRECPALPVTLSSGETVVLCVDPTLMKARLRLAAAGAVELSRVPPAKPAPLGALAEGSSTPRLRFEGKTADSRAAELTLELRRGPTTGYGGDVQGGGGGCEVKNFDGTAAVHFQRRRIELTVRWQDERCNTGSAPAR